MIQFKKEHLWPLMVVAILAGSVVANIILVMASQADGGAQAIPDYYEHAIEESNKSMGVTE